MNNSTPFPGAAIEDCRAQPQHLSVEGHRTEPRQWQSQAHQGPQGSVNDSVLDQTHVNHNHGIKSSCETVKRTPGKLSPAATQLTRLRRKVHWNFDVVIRNSGEIKKSRNFRGGILNRGLPEWDDLWEAQENIMTWDARRGDPNASSEGIEAARQIALGYMHGLCSSYGRVSMTGDVPAPTAVMVPPGGKGTAASNPRQQNISQAEDDLAKNHMDDARDDAIWTDYDCNISNTTQTRKRAFRAVHANPAALCEDHPNWGLVGIEASPSQNKRRKTADDSQDLMDILARSARAAPEPRTSLIVRLKVPIEASSTQGVDQSTNNIAIINPGLPYTLPPFDTASSQNNVASSSDRPIGSARESTDQTSTRSSEMASEGPAVTSASPSPAAPLSRAPSPEVPLKHESVDPFPQPQNQSATRERVVIVIPDDEEDTPSTLQPPATILRGNVLEDTPSILSPQAITSRDDANEAVDSKPQHSRTPNNSIENPPTTSAQRPSNIHIAEPFAETMAESITTPVPTAYLPSQRTVETSFSPPRHLQHIPTSRVDLIDIIMSRKMLQIELIDLQIEKRIILERKSGLTSSVMANGLR
jgi:hypothetical protein